MVEIKKNKDKPFFIGITKESKVQYDVIYEKMRDKQKLIDMFKTQINELKDKYGENCENAKYLECHIEDIKNDLSELWDQFRGKIKEKVKKTIYVPMTVDHAINYLSFLMVDNPIKNDVEIRCVLDCIRNETALQFSTKNKHTLDRLKDNLEYIKEVRGVNNERIESNTNAK